MILRGSRKFDYIAKYYVSFNAEMTTLSDIQ